MIDDDLLPPVQGDRRVTLPERLGVARLGSRTHGRSPVRRRFEEGKQTFPRKRPEVDYPHPEGTDDPAGRFERTFKDLDDGARDLFYHKNFEYMMQVG